MTTDLELQPRLPVWFDQKLDQKWKLC